MKNLKQKTQFWDKGYLWTIAVIMIAVIIGLLVGATRVQASTSLATIVGKGIFENIPMPLMMAIYFGVGILGLGLIWYCGKWTMIAGHEDRKEGERIGNKKQEIRGARSIGIAWGFFAIGLISIVSVSVKAHEIAGAMPHDESFIAASVLEVEPSIPDLGSFKMEEGEEDPLEGLDNEYTEEERRCDGIFNKYAKEYLEKNPAPIGVGDTIEEHYKLMHKWVDSKNTHSRNKAILFDISCTDRANLMKEVWIDV